MSSYGDQFHFLDKTFLWIFVLEALLKITAEFPRVDRYFRQGWNIFDFTIVVLSFLPMGQFSTIARMVRLLRLARLIHFIPELRLIIITLLRSLPGMFHIVVLLGLLFYIYAVTGYYLFHQADPLHWGNLGACLLTLFGIVTLEGWVESMKAVLHVHPLAWVFFVSFIVMGTFMFINLFVAVVINNLAEAKEERIRDLNLPVTQEELLKELRAAKEALVRLEHKLQKNG
jgi:voltage-gated sodium channel